MNFLQENFNISESNFIVFDAMRQTAQCLGRVIRGKNDYGLMVLADRVYKFSYDFSYLQFIKEIQQKRQTIKASLMDNHLQVLSNHKSFLG